MEIVVLGTGCAKCKNVEMAAQEAVKKAGISADIRKEEDIVKIMEYNVMTTPALVIDGKVVVKGRVPSVDEVVELITK